MFNKLCKNQKCSTKIFLVIAVTSPKLPIAASCVLSISLRKKSTKILDRSTCDVLLSLS